MLNLNLYPPAARVLRLHNLAKDPVELGRSKERVELDPITDGKEPGLEAIMPSSPTNSSTGSTGIIDELRSQAALLQYALAQQRKIMGEMAILRHESSVSAQVI